MKAGGGCDVCDVSLTVEKLCGSITRDVTIMPCMGHNHLG